MYHMTCLTNEKDEVKRTRILKEQDRTFQGARRVKKGSRVKYRIRKWGEKQNPFAEEDYDHPFFIRCVFRKDYYLRYKKTSVLPFLTLQNEISDLRINFASSFLSSHLCLPHRSDLWRSPVLSGMFSKVDQF